MNFISPSIVVQEAERSSLLITWYIMCRYELWKDGFKKGNIGASFCVLTGEISVLMKLC
jgi:hypothetical protein